MHDIEVKMVFFEFFQMVLHLGASKKDGQFLKKSVILLGFHW
jgi:hypothetical protein